MIYGQRAVVALSLEDPETDTLVRHVASLTGETPTEAAPLSADHAPSAVDAFRRFGEGRHEAGLNFGDCLAQATGEPLIFTGGDFAQTDVERVF